MEHAKKQNDFFREFRVFRSCQKLLVVERLFGSVFRLFAVSSAATKLNKYEEILLCPLKMILVLDSIAETF